MNVAAQRRLMEKPQDLNVSIGYAEFDPVAPQSLDYLIRQAYKDMIKSMGEANQDSEADDSPENESPSAEATEDKPESEL